MLALVEEGGGVVVVRYLDTNRGLITPSWVTWVRVSDVRPETPHDLGYITEDVSRLHHKVYLSTNSAWWCH